MDVVPGQVCAVWIGADGGVCGVYGLSHEAEGSVLGACEMGWKVEASGWRVYPICRA
jgi:hypothetical protein